MATSLLEKQQKALRGSIGKWTMIVDGLKHDREIVESGTTDCDCCIEFFEPKSGTKYCNNCPVRNSSGNIMCRDTPYKKWYETLMDVNSYTEHYCPTTHAPEDTRKLLKLAKKQLKFLISVASDLK